MTCCDVCQGETAAGAQWCGACSRAYDRWRRKFFGPTEHDVIAWAAKRARDAERARHMRATSRWRGEA